MRKKWTTHFRIMNDLFPRLRKLISWKGKMPLYDCMLLLKPNVQKEPLIALVIRIGKHVQRRNGVLTHFKHMGNVQLGYGIKKLDGRYYQGQLMQMTMMTPPSFNSELSYLNKEDLLLRWLLVKHRDMKFGPGYFGEDDAKNELWKFRSNIVDDDDDDIEENADDDDDDEYDVNEQSETKEG